MRRIWKAGAGSRCWSNRKRPLDNHPCSSPYPLPDRLQAFYRLTGDTVGGTDHCAAMAYFTGFMPTLLPPPAPLPSFHPAASIPFSFACPPNPSSSSAASAGPSSVSSSRHASLQARWPPPPVSSTARRPRASRPSGFGDGGAVESPRDDASVRARPSVHRDRLRHEHEGGLVRLLQGRAPLGVDLAAEKRDLSDEEQEVEYRVRLLSSGSIDRQPLSNSLILKTFILSYRIKSSSTTDILFLSRSAPSGRRKRSRRSCVFSDRSASRLPLSAMD